MKLTTDFKERCEGIATRLRAELGLKAFDALSGPCLAEYLGVVVVDVAQLAPLLGVPEAAIEVLVASRSWSAMLIGVVPPLLVQRPHASTARSESNMMHELAHHLLRHKPVGLSTEKVPERRVREEREAEYLGGCLQIPRRGLLWASQKGFSVPETAEHFGASCDMVCFRYNMTGVVLPK